MRQLRQPRLAEIVAAKLRDEILAGRLTEGDSLPRQEHLFTEFRVSLPAVREAMRILETEGLISVRRGNVGGAVVHLPTPMRIARTISMVLQTRQTTMADVSGALMHLEPSCAALCAARPDRMQTTVPALRGVIEQQKESYDDPAQFAALARRFHETLVETCGNETMIVIIGSLETIWTAHESTVWSEATLKENDEPTSPTARKSLHAAVRDHEKLVDAIEAGDEARAVRLATAHLAATRTSSLDTVKGDVVNTNLLDTLDLNGG
ncbi:GntR family transcriptional regulator [Rhizocola hellebori]|uniref:GntR family transcriptional regulator n=1 Tax=Rhizocola hellebori TaxID=1392758 RepID=A0A8J3QBM0_9ACTN|nr:FCD domain-containing protein [Rhizocola hellebori]GIH06698.1 GntR family transcriptional regulator [Rhizocola hellebori]